MRVIRLDPLSSRLEADLQLIARLAEVNRAVEDLLAHEPDSRVARDWPGWHRRIVTALSRGRRHTSNLLTWRWGGGELSYVRALADLLGAPFKVEQVCDVFGGTYTEISW